MEPSFILSYAFGEYSSLAVLIFCNSLLIFRVAGHNVPSNSFIPTQKRENNKFTNYQSTDTGRMWNKIKINHKTVHVADMRIINCRTQNRNPY